MGPDVGRRLTDYYDVLASQAGGTNTLSPRIAELQADKDFMAASRKDQKAYLAHIDPDFAKRHLWTKARIWDTLPESQERPVDIDGHMVQFVQDVSEEEMNETARTFDAALRRILTLKRMTLLCEALGSWIGPAIALYALGLAFRWVRRGFGTPAT